MLKLQTFGGLSVSAAPLPGRTLALLALLAIAGERGVSREKVLAFLWPESDHDAALGALEELLGELRRSVHAEPVVAGDAELRLDAGVIESDVGTFEDLLDRRATADAIALYEGAFLEGFEIPECPELERWARGERMRLEQRYRGALEALAGDASAAGDHRAAAAWWRRLALADPLSTHVAIEVMTELAASGDRAAALQHAREHERLLQREYRAVPNAAVRALADRLRAEGDATPPVEGSPSTRADRRADGPATRGLPRPDPGASDEESSERLLTSRERGALIAGRYLMERELGRGGMATVFLARDLKHDRAVALKFVHAELATSLGTERFQREIALLAKLQHPHILPLYDSGEVEGSLYYVMPYVGGESLRQRLERESQLAVGDALRIVGEVADALAYAHAQDVIHRDIKPQNILLASGHALLSDFGIARAVSRAAGRRITDDGFAVGTPTYMSPEQASGDPIDGRSDQYSLACVLYEMLAGKPPFTGTSSRSIIAQRFTDPPAPIRRSRETVPQGVDDAVARALSRVPSDRFASVAEFAAALESAERASRIRHALPSTSSEPGAGSRFWRWLTGGADAR